MKKENSTHQILNYASQSLRKFCLLVIPYPLKDCANNKQSNYILKVVMNGWRHTVDRLPQLFFSSSAWRIKKELDEQKKRCQLEMAGVLGGTRRMSHCNPFRGGGGGGEGDPIA